MILLDAHHFSHASLFTSLNFFFNEYLYTRSKVRNSYCFRFTVDTIKVFTSRPMVLAVVVVISDEISISTYNISPAVTNQLVSFLNAELGIDPVKFH